MIKTRPLKSRRWLSRYGRRLDHSARYYTHKWRGDHRRWWEEGQQALQGEGLDPSDECPF